MTTVLRSFRERLPLKVFGEVESSPVFFDSPHSGRDYPDDFHSNSPRAALRRGEDAYVDELLLPSVADGATLLINEAPRCYIDVNRERTDIDPAQLSGPWPEHAPALAPTDKSVRGLGLIRRFVVPGIEAQAGPLSVDAVIRRIEHVYDPYHQRLAALVRSIHQRHGIVWHVDWHSMKSVGNAMTPDGAGARRADFVVSDVRGKSCGPHVTEIIVDTLRTLGYIVTVNDPYVGGTIVQRTGAPASEVHSIQVEINRALYLDEIAVEKTRGFGVLADNLRSLTRRLVDAARHR